MDQDSLEDFIKREAPLLCDLIAGQKSSGHAEINLGIADSVEPRTTVIRLEELLRVDSENSIKNILSCRETWDCFLKTVAASNFLSSVMRRSPELIRSIFVEGAYTRTKTRSQKEAELKIRLSALPKATQEDLCRELRHYKEEEFLRIGCRDLSGIAPVTEIMAELSDFAAAALSTTLDYHFERLVEKHGSPIGLGPGKYGFVILSMGKLSGRELNFSSDIDLIYLRGPEKGYTDGSDRIFVTRFYEVLAKNISRSMSDLTEDGFVFRVDLRLRPEGEKGELAPSVSNATEYYLSWGRTWERAALMKALPIAGDIDLGYQFLSGIEPFIYRKHLDYSTLDDMRSMKKQIEIQIKKKPGLNIKLGQGGIREIEFFVQALQLINGGKNPKLRSPSTLTALELLVDAGILNSLTSKELEDAYLFFRNVEHRIQIEHQLQKHELPRTVQDQRELAQRMGYKGSGALDNFLDDLEQKRKLVEELFTSLFYHSPEDSLQNVSSVTRHLIESIEDHDETVAILTDLGFRNPSSAYPIFRNLVFPSVGRAVPEKSRELLERLAPLFIDELLKTPEPEKALAGLDSYISSLSAAPHYYSTFWENPPTLRFLIRILGESRFFTDLLTRHPESIDSLIGRGSEKSSRNPETLKRELFDRLDFCEGYEDKLNVLRTFKNEETLLTGVRQLNGEIDSPHARKLIAELADVSLAAAVEIARSEMALKFGSEGLTSPFPFVVLGMGKLGGMEMTYLSDLDVIFVFDTPSEKIGRLPSREWFARLANRIISILSVPTSEGSVFSIDTRLRPSGNKGPLVSTLESFKSYHRESSALWEKQALIRSRVVVGPSELRNRVETVIRECILQAHITEQDIAEIARIRERMEKEIAMEDSANADLKTGKGGLVDVEFFTQGNILLHARNHPEILKCNTLEALDSLRTAGIIGKETYESLDSGYRFLTNLEDRLRIMENRSIDRLPLSGSKLEGLAKRLGYGNDGETLVQEYLATRSKIRAIYNSFFIQDNSRN
ncbi:MAG: bifunctional [glutamate--ammonia ligase]-adenylyl-L-tyrosine phosphorylase/[glutamate--ammonia-ligase] adenylyltransferase [Desulfomonilaceae bacterium]